MTEPKKAWWKKRRWIATGALWLALAYPALAGPARYSTAHLWVPRGVYEVFRPAEALARSRVGEASGYAAYHRWWEQRSLVYIFGCVKVPWWEKVLP